MRLRIDLKTCAKSGQCYYMHPELVRRGKANLPELIAGDVPEALREDAETLADICPTGSIEIIED